MDDALPDPLALWFTDRGWTPRRHQLDMLAAAQAGQHALLVAPTGAGKTLAGFLPVLADLIATGAEGLTPLYISPRSEERRVGKACVSTCSSRWSAVT